MTATRGAVAREAVARGAVARGAAERRRSNGPARTATSLLVTRG